MLKEMDYPTDMDTICIQACNALNLLPGVETQYSCSGHGNDNGYIIFSCDDMSVLKSIAKAVLGIKFRAKEFNYKVHCWIVDISPYWSDKDEYYSRDKICSKIRCSYEAR